VGCDSLAVYDISKKSFKKAGMEDKDGNLPFVAKVCFLSAIAHLLALY
jgi:hypothetical protein